MKKITISSRKNDFFPYSVKWQEGSVKYCQVFQTNQGARDFIKSRFSAGKYYIVDNSVESML